MSKTLITKRNLDNFLEKGANNIIVDKSIILSPSVKDVLKERGVKIIYKNDIEENKGKRDIIQNITKILKEDFNLKDENLIKQVAIKVLEKVNDSK